MEKTQNYIHFHNVHCKIVNPVESPIVLSNTLHGYSRQVLRASSKKKLSNLFKIFRFAVFTFCFWNLNFLLTWPQSCNTWRGPSEQFFHTVQTVLVIHGLNNRSVVFLTDSYSHFLHDYSGRNLRTQLTRKVRRLMLLGQWFSIFDSQRTTRQNKYIWRPQKGLVFCCFAYIVCNTSTGH